MPLTIAGSLMNLSLNWILRLSLKIVLFLTLHLVGCSDDLTCDSTLEQSVTYTTDIAPLFEAKCNYCHNHEKTGVEREGAPVGVDYTTYAASVANALGALDEIVAAEMPPVCEACPPVPNAEQANLLCNWIKQGTPE